MGQRVLFSNTNRKERTAAAQAQVYDLIVIGGGITGAGIALDATLRGMKVLLVEKSDFASGTSSKSTKLIHGGLRYLKQLEFGLVRETGLERSVAHHNAFHLVHPENMLLPLVHQGTFNKLTAGLAITVYDFLAKVPAQDRKDMLDKEEAMEMEPLLDAERVKSAIVYSEYRTDDARLTMEVIKAAHREGAELFNYMEVESFVVESRLVKGVHCQDRLSQQKITFRGNSIINATGPWADDLRLKEDAKSETNLRLSKGVHLVFDRKDLPINNSTYFDVFDGRMVFAIPRANRVYVGTTDTDFNGDLDQMSCTQADVDYILTAINNFFKIPPLTIHHVQSTWAGLRPLIQQKGKSATEVSRKDEIFISTNGLITIAGGKLTGFRKMAERVIDLVYERTKKKLVPCSTEEYKISLSPFSSYQNYLDYAEKLNEDYQGKVERQEIEYLVRTYGKEANFIIEQATAADATQLDIADRLAQAQLDYGIQYESIAHPMDFLDRRTGWLFFDIAQCRKYLSKAIDTIGKSLPLKEEQLEVFADASRKRIDTNSLVVLKQNNKEV
jgi:glycerol-3-phosphate dehydrogenase